MAKTDHPDEGRVHFFATSTAEEWVPAFAGMVLLLVQRPLPRVRAPAVVAQPEPDEVAAAVRLGPVLVLGAAVAEGSVVDEL
ncbi:MAG TPA: hypothetical protein VGR70_03105, partial [Stellaceae bacterium]|nr:hypothetical protein [Stellaceae bacterium]